MKHTLLTPPDVALAALDGVVAGLSAVRSQMRVLEAAEALLMQAGVQVAEAVAAAGGRGGREMAYRMVESEIGAALHESDRTISDKMGRAARLVEEYPAVYGSLAAGRITAAHAHVIVDAGLVISDASARAQYESRVLPYAEAETVGRLRPAAKRLAEVFAERSIEERHEEATRSRCVAVVDREDGMADLVAHLPAVYAHGIKDRLSQFAHGVVQERRRVARETATGAAGAEACETEGGVSAGRDARTVDERTVDEIRADVFTDLLLAGDPSVWERGDAEQIATGVSGVTARVQLVVPVRRLVTRHDTGRPRDAVSVFGGLEDSLTHPGCDGPVLLEGVGPVAAATVREVAGRSGSWDRVNVDALTGEVLSVDSYQPSAAMRRYLGARDLHCRFPGCRVPIRKCDIDHTVAAACGGATATDNLGALCRRHHTLKHATPWRVSQDRCGVYTWESPTGRRYADVPASRVRFAPVEGTPASETGVSRPGKRRDAVETVRGPVRPDTRGDVSPLPGSGRGAVSGREQLVRFRAWKARMVAEGRLSDPSGSF